MTQVSRELLEKATKLANRPYRIVATPDQLEPDTPVFFVTNPELPGCNSHGATLDEAMENLADARLIYIASLLEDGLDIPEPEQIANDQ